MRTPRRCARLPAVIASAAKQSRTNAGARLLVHLPNKDWVSREDAKKLAASGTKILTTIGFGAPVFGVFAQDTYGPASQGQAR